MRMSERDRRDWSLLIFIVPIGILFMLIAGQFGMRITPFWTLNARMRSNLEIEAAGGRQAVIPLFNIGILTPFAWQNSYLTPNTENGFAFPPFIVLEPSATPSPTAVPTTETAAPPEETPTPTETPPPTSVTRVATGTPSAPPPEEGTDPPPTDTPPATASPTDTPTAAPTGIISTVPAGYTEVAPPTEIGVGTLPDGTPGDATNVGAIPDGTYIVIGLSIFVAPIPDANYDLVFYEHEYVAGSIYFDSIIIGITNNPNGTDYYEVFNWGNGVPDTNSNVGDVAGTEADNQVIPTSELYDPDETPGAPPVDGPAPQTGILIDVDRASSSPPPNTTYDFVVIISPNGGSAPPEAAQVDAIQTVEVLIPTPPPTP